MLESISSRFELNKRACLPKYEPENSHWEDEEADDVADIYHCGQYVDSSHLFQLKYTQANIRAYGNLKEARHEDSKCASCQVLTNLARLCHPAYLANLPAR